jgi:hypothetical protein
MFDKFDGFFDGDGGFFVFIVYIDPFGVFTFSLGFSGFEG